MTTIKKALSKTVIARHVSYIAWPGSPYDKHKDVAGGHDIRHWGSIAEAIGLGRMGGKVIYELMEIWQEDLAAKADDIRTWLG